MKKKLFFAGSILTLALIASSTFITNSQNSNSALLFKNIEALADGESISIPCNSGGSNCKFNVTSSDGTEYEMTVAELKDK